MTTTSLWNKEAIYHLLRYGYKNDGDWTDEDIWQGDAAYQIMPDHTDADLIASAPELLEALQELLSWDTLAPVEAVKNAKTVIKSVQGES